MEPERRSPAGTVVAVTTSQFRNQPRDRSRTREQSRKGRRQRGSQLSVWLLGNVSATIGVVVQEGKERI